MPKEEKVELEGEVVEALPNAMFRVKLDNMDRVVLGHVAGKMRRFRIRILPGRSSPGRALAVRPRSGAHRLSASLTGESGSLGRWGQWPASGELRFSGTRPGGRASGPRAGGEFPKLRCANSS